MSIADARKALADQQAELRTELRTLSEKGDETARRRKDSARSAVRDVAVQGTGTVLGGAVLAGLAQIVGILPTDTASITVAAVASSGLVLSVITSIGGFTRSPVSDREFEILNMLQALDRASQHIGQSSTESDDEVKTT